MFGRRALIIGLIATNIIFAALFAISMAAPSWFQSIGSVISNNKPSSDIINNFNARREKLIEITTMLNGKLSSGLSQRELPDYSAQIKAAASMAANALSKDPSHAAWVEPRAKALLAAETTALKADIVALMWRNLIFGDCSNVGDGSENTVSTCKEKIITAYEAMGINAPSRFSFSSYSIPPTSDDIIRPLLSALSAEIEQTNKSLLALR